MTALRITANLPAVLEAPLRRQAKSEIYPSDSDYGVGLFLWDIYSRQDHALTGPLMMKPRWMIDQFAEELAVELGERPQKASALKPFRYTVSIPGPLAPFVEQRVHEIPYRSNSAYISGLVFFDLKTRGPDPKRVPHRKTAPLLQRPEWIKDAVFLQLAKDFGNPARKWPDGIDGRIDELVKRQQELELK